MASSSQAPQLTKEQAVYEAWRRGRLRYKLRPWQRPLYDKLWAAIQDPTCASYAVNASRRFGKTTTFMVIAFEVLLRTPGSLCRYASFTQKSCHNVLQPIYRWLIEDCPPDFLPKLGSDNIIKFHNGSELHMAGVDGGHDDDLRGNASNLSIVDEGGFFSTDVEYILNSVLLPQQTTTGGTTLLASTPPKSPQHPWVKVFRQHEVRGHSVTIPINEFRDQLPEHEVAAIKAITESYGGETSTSFRREFLCHFITDAERQIIPEVPEVGSPTIDEYRQYYHNYVSIDHGTSDLTAGLWGHYNFKEATLYIERELTINHRIGEPMADAINMKATTKDLAEHCVKIETELGWQDYYRRVLDVINPQVQIDLASLYGYSTTPPSKKNLEAMVNEARTWLREGRVVIDPSCKILLRSLEAGIWTKPDSNGKRQFDRLPGLGHCDHVAALVYMIRSIDVHSNPVPHLHNFQEEKQFVSPENRAPQPSGLHSTLNNVFRRNRHHEEQNYEY